MKAKDKLLPHLAYRAVRPDDIEGLDLMDCFQSDVNAKSRTMDCIFTYGFLAYSILDPQGHVIAVMGATPLHRNSIEVWALVDKKAVKQSKYYSHATKFLIEHNFDMLNMVRMQVIIKADQKWADRWAKFLGFEREGVLRRYGEEAEDHVIYAKVRE